MQEAKSSSDLEDLGREMAERKHDLGGRLHPPRRLATTAKRALTKVQRAVTATFNRSRRTLRRTKRSESAARRR